MARMHAAFHTENAEATELYSGELGATRRHPKLDGSLGSPVEICLTCDRDRAGPVVAGRTLIRTTDLMSSVPAVSNLDAQPAAAASRNPSSASSIQAP